MPKSEKLNEFLELTKTETENYQQFVRDYLKKATKITLLLLHGVVIKKIMNSLENYLQTWV